MGRASTIKAKRFRLPNRIAFAHESQFDKHRR